MRYVIVDIETGEYAHAKIARYLPMNEHIEIPFAFKSKEDAMDVLDKMPFPEWQFYEIVEE
jgi:hypothetical protein